MVSPIIRSQINALPDMLSADRFVLLFSNIPNTKNNPFTDFSIKVLQGSIPGVNQEDFQVSIASFVRNFRGRKIFDNNVNFSMAETVDFTTHNTLRAWHEYIAGTESGNSGGYSDDYAVTATIYTFDTTGLQVDAANFYKIRPVSLPDTLLSNDNTSPMMTSCNFAFDWVDFNSINIL